MIGPTPEQKEALKRLRREERKWVVATLDMKYGKPKTEEERKQRKDSIRNILGIRRSRSWEKSLEMEIARTKEIMKLIPGIKKEAVDAAVGLVVDAAKALRGRF